MFMNHHQLSRWALAAGLSAALLLPAACDRGTDKADVREKTQEAVEAMKAYAEQQRVEHREIMRDRLKNIHDQIQELRAELGDLQKDVRAELEGSIETLKQNYQAIDQELTGIERAEKAEWDKIRDELGMALKELETAYRSAAARLDIPIEGGPGSPAAGREQTEAPAGVPAAEAQASAQPASGG